MGSKLTIFSYALALTAAGSVSLAAPTESPESMRSPQTTTPEARKTEKPKFGDRSTLGSRYVLPPEAKKTEEAKAPAQRGAEGTVSATTGAAADMVGAKTVQLGRNYEVITFNKGASKLSESDKNSIRSLIDMARADGEISRVSIVAWSDKPFPAGAKASNLPKNDRNLAKNRIVEIEKFMKSDLAVEGLHGYNMALRTHWYARAFNTREAELKSLFAQRGAPAEALPEHFDVVKKFGGPTKAVITIEHKGRRAMEGSSSGMTSGQSDSSDAGTRARKSY